MCTLCRHKKPVSDGSVVFNVIKEKSVCDAANDHTTNLEMLISRSKKKIYIYIFKYLLRSSQM